MNEGLFWRGRRISRREFLGVAAAGTGAVFLGGLTTSCGGGGGEGEGYRLALIVGVTGDEFYTTMECGARAAARKLGARLNVQGPEEFSPAAQTPILNAVVQSNPDAILIAPTDRTAMVGPIQSAVNQDIPVVLVDTTIEKEEIALARISSDNVEGGRMAGEALAEQIGGKGKVLLISVKPGISTTDQRKQGFEEAIKQYPDIEYLGTEYCNDDPTQAASITTSTLQAHPDLAGIFGANVFSGQGAGTGVRQAGKRDQVSVVAFDASPTQVEDLRRGNLDVLIAQHPNDIGRRGVQIAVRYLESGEEPENKQITTGFTTVTRDNLDAPEVERYLYRAQC
ncbi:Twin-arginine translocation pathway signal [Rubrobacter xylanophilus DSM 9941]|uniref:Twin-arginine translocation pathway signal n=1 Tax=Rubrobacter xylanophilus (strain DSM 9941 / JCM 11954 / NBRC 16129 / PRD-1) TaxID=266117 RepID=Q1ASV8_RUBXD|nr:ABC transporter substrate-binding protein [Rubrobacter xylanophilus]ABG05520.1 Twin-arginine translocation pathway signal [Rubrobacter xylanophilus DSM 9941]